MYNLTHKETVKKNESEELKKATGRGFGKTEKIVNK